MTQALRVDGVDISHHQDGKLDMKAAMDAGVRWMYHKATEGGGYKDPNYEERRKQARAAGLPFGAYHFARPSGSSADATTEAALFLRTARVGAGDLRPMLDLEDDAHVDAAELRRWTKTFVDAVLAGCGAKPVIYTPFDLGDVVTQGCLIWRPRYNNSNTPPVLPWDIWQFSNGVLGKPDSIPGFGYVDLNVMKGGVKLRHLMMPGQKQKGQKHHVKIKAIQASMQFGDSTPQQTHDINAIFSRGADIITGSEAGPGAGKQTAILHAAANRYHYTIYLPDGTDCWVAVKDELVDGGWRHGFTKTSGTGKQEGDPHHYAAKGLVWVSFHNKQLGRVSVGTAHYLTRDKDPGDPGHHRQENKQIANAIGDFAIKEGAGKGLVFVGADTNMVDKQDDVFFGEPLTTLWDELDTYENTGHGNIDVLASYDRDGRVVGKQVKALDDKELFLHMDHFLVEGTYTVEV
jgi:GH25 family lysozyme M1 (1,4-beta-N-acetylmuramidase)